MKKLLAILAFSAFAAGSFAQDFKVPKDVVLKEAADYKEYEEDVINCVDWLMKTPVNEQETKRREANAFLITWISGSPNVSVQLDEKVVNFMKPNAELLIIFMGGWTKYVLETGDTDALQGNLNGIQSVITFYKANKSNLKKDKNVEKYIKMQENGTLEAYLKNPEK